MPTWLIDLKLDEPFTCGARPVVGNEIGALDYIPGTNLRGALAAALRYEHASPDMDKWFGFSPQGTVTFRYSPAWPLPIKDDDRVKSVVPMPLGFLYDKGDDGFQGKVGVWNHVMSEGSPPTNAETDPTHRYQWTRPRHRWLALDADNKPLFGFNAIPENAIHVGLHYARRASRQGALFSQSRVAAGSRFTAWISGKEMLPEKLPERIFLGKRRSAGNGSATLASRYVRPPFAWDAQGDIISIALLSDTIVPAGDRAGYRTGLNAEFWNELCDAELIRADSASLVVQGWSSTWGVPREPAVAIAAGSVFRLRRKGATNIERLKSLATDGLGFRTQEGFGWVAVNPPWLRVGPGPITSTSTEERAPRHPNPTAWPGQSLAREAQIRLAQTARGLSVLLHEDGPKVVELAVRAGRGDNVQPVQAYLNRMAGRTNPREWDRVRMNLASVRFEVLPIEEARFLLHVTAGLVRDRRNS